MADNGENPSFDVYGMLLVLGFIATGAATFILYTDLDENWNYGRDMKVAVNITQMNSDPKAHPDVFDLTKQDLEDWQSINKGAKFPIEGYEWPTGFDPYTNKVKADTNNLETVKEDARKALLGGDPEAAASAPPAPAPAPTTPPADAATPPAEQKKE